MNKETCISILLGVAIGDALGVPVEFKKRSYLKENPVTDMIGFGTHKVAEGTWSDDSSLTFCLAEAIIEGYSIDRSAEKMIKWYTENYWTADNDVFDIGNTILKAIVKLRSGVPASMSGSSSVNSNGNGSLMRMSPLIVYLQNKPIETRFNVVKAESSITHSHIVSVIACFYFVEFGIGLLQGKEKHVIYRELQQTLPVFLTSQAINEKEIKTFERLLNEDIKGSKVMTILSSGYVVHSLTAAIWCLLNTNSFEDAVLQAVNLGDETDTNASIVGALAAMAYGKSQIPEKWINVIKRKNDIIDLGSRLAGII